MRAVAPEAPRMLEEPQLGTDQDAGAKAATVVTAWPPSPGPYHDASQ